MEEIVRNCLGVAAMVILGVFVLATLAKILYQTWLDDDE